MYSLSLVVTRLGVVLAVLCGAVGVAVHGPQDGFLWSVVGYFAGKSIRSVFRTVGAGRTA